MTPRLVARLVVLLALLAPIAISAQTFIKQDVASKLFIELNSAGSSPAKLMYSSGKATLDAQAERAHVTYSASGLVVDLSEGSFTQSDLKEPWRTQSKGTFKAMQVQFGANGDMTSVTWQKD